MNGLYKINDGHLYATGNLKFELENSVVYKGASIVHKLSFADHFTDDLSIAFIESKLLNNNSLEMVVELTNNSLDDLSDVYVYSTSLFSIWCSSIYFDKNLAMLPSKSTIVVKDTLQVYNDIRVNTNLCFYTGGAARIFDLNFSNNYDCAIISGIQDVDLLKGLKIYPNPSSEYLEIDREFQNKDYTIYNANGLLVQASTYNDQINTSQLAKGLYFLRIEIPGGTLIEKFVKQ